MIYGIIIAVILLQIVIFWYKSPNQKGKRGEKSVSKTLSKINGQLINDYYIIDENSKSHQIDHILVCSKGVVIVETKNYSGRIYGSDNQMEWTQVLNYGKTKNKFYNPVKQNNSHLYHIGKILNNKYKLISVIIFVQDNIEFINSEKVFSKRSAYQYIDSLPDIYDEDTVAEIVKTLKDKQTMEVITKEHVANIKSTIEEINNNICPRCGKQLILRKGKNGEFYGCSGYPNCKFTKRL